MTDMIHSPLAPPSSPTWYLMPSLSPHPTTPLPAAMLLPVLAPHTLETTKLQSSGQAPELSTQPSDLDLTMCPPESIVPQTLLPAVVAPMHVAPPLLAPSRAPSCLNQAPQSPYASPEPASTVSS